METVIVIVIVALAAGYLLVTVRKRTQQGGGCHCEGPCPNCPPSENCEEKRSSQASK